MKLFLAAATAAATLATVGAASAQPMHGYGSGRQSYGQDYGQAANGWRGSSYAQSDWGRRDLTGYTAAHGAYNRGGYAGYGAGWRDRDDWRRNQTYGPMGSQVYPNAGLGYAVPIQRALRSHW
ncbi:MAG TPA: hypothetical protein VF678_10620 [bacterium]